MAETIVYTPWRVKKRSFLKKKKKKAKNLVRCSTFSGALQVNLKGLRPR